MNHFSYADLDATSPSDFIVNSITFDAAAGAFVISNGGPGGSTIKLQGNITNNSTNLQTINFHFQLDGGNRTVNTSAGDIAIGGIISQDSARTLSQTGTNTLTLSAANTHSFTQIGTTNGATAGTVSIKNNAALGTGNLDYGAGGTLQLGVNGLSVANGVFVGNRTDTAARTIQLDLAGSNTGELTGNIDIRVDQTGEFVADVGTEDTLTFSGNLVTGAGGNAGLTKAGAGTLVLEGTNTYTGQTKINSGILQLDGTHTQAKSGSDVKSIGAYTIGVNGTLTGGGATLGSVTVNSILSPGNSPGTLSTGAQTWNDGGSYLWEINDSDGTKGMDSGWDFADITGTLDLSSLTEGGFTIDITSLDLSNISGDAAGFDSFDLTPGTVDYSFVIATASGGITGFEVSDFILDYSAFSNADPLWEWTISQSGDDLILNAIAVPEPSASAALVGLSVSVLLMRRRRR